MAQKSSHNVMVVGACIIGLTTAIRLREEGDHVTILTKETPSTFYSRETSPLKGVKPSTYTSPASGGLWGPINLEGDQLQELASKTFARFEKEAKEGVGVEMVEGYVLHRNEKVMDIPWFSKVTLVTTETPESDGNIPTTHKSAFRYKAPVVDMKEYMLHLEKRARDMGVKVKLTCEHSDQGDHWNLERVCSFAKSEFSGKVTIVNCCGMGAQEESGEKMIPGRGLSVRVSRPLGVNNFVVEYGQTSNMVQEGQVSQNVCISCVPQRTEYALGSSLAMGSSCEEVDTSEVESLIERCAEILPSIKRSKVEGVRTGLRPFTEGLVVSTEKQAVEHEREIEMVANYGHGGLGVTLCWGCADEVAQIVSGTGEGSSRCLGIGI